MACIDVTTQLELYFHEKIQVTIANTACLYSAWVYIAS